MALGWVSVLQLVPWGEVIANAPKIADTAKKLWGTVAKKPDRELAGAADTLSPQARLDAAEAQIAQLHEQMLASSELIKALAEQNTQLVKRVETMRRGTLVLAVVTLLTLILTVTGLALGH
ncbi:MAG TPA: hypothetical protein VLC92_11210 [Rhodocyclaceae bacterium]|nr:hypothetical protein [Rhodocyclaceae bacterium]